MDVNTYPVFIRPASLDSKLPTPPSNTEQKITAVFKHTLENDDAGPSFINKRPRCTEFPLPNIPINATSIDLAGQHKTAMIPLDISRNSAQEDPILKKSSSPPPLPLNKETLAMSWPDEIKTALIKFMTETRGYLKERDATDDFRRVHNLLCSDEAVHTKWRTDLRVDTFKLRYEGGAKLTTPMFNLPAISLSKKIKWTPELEKSLVNLIEEQKLDYNTVSKKLNLPLDAITMKYRRLRYIKNTPPPSKEALETIKDNLTQLFKAADPSNPPNNDVVSKITASTHPAHKNAVSGHLRRLRLNLELSKKS